MGKKTIEMEALAKEFGAVLIYLFGSQADAGFRYLEGETVTADECSDLDIAVLFDKTPSNTVDIYSTLFSKLSDIFEPFNVDLLFMHEVETLFHYEIITGILVYARTDDICEAFEELVLKKAADLSHKRRIMNENIMEAIEDGYFEFEYRPNP